jgi:hypothetical protein
VRAAGLFTTQSPWELDPGIRELSEMALTKIKIKTKLYAEDQDCQSRIYACVGTTRNSPMKSAIPNSNGSRSQQGNSIRRKSTDHIGGDQASKNCALVVLLMLSLGVDYYR